ncbi:MAG: hypothetical protein KDM91_07900 [Verrucomicrobiae bacterium]|nr:hypothetical protein [Verrucomicrobiae bacterium]
MADPTNTNSEPSEPSPRAEKARRRWLFRWLVKLFAWFGAMILVAAVIVCGVAWLAWRNLTGLANLVASEFAAPYRIEMGHVDASKKGVIRVRDLRLSPDTLPEGAPPLLAIAGVTLDYDLAELRAERKFRRIALEGPVVRLSDASLPGGEGKAADGGEDGGAAPDLSALRKLTDQLSVKGGRVESELTGAPPFSFNWELEAGALDFAAEEWLSEAPVTLKLADVTAGKNGDLLRAAKIDAAVKVRPNLGAIEVDELALGGFSARLTPADLAAFGEKNAEPSSPAAGGDGEATPKNGAGKGKGGGFAVVIRRLRLPNARFAAAGFDGSAGAGSMPVLPDVSFETSVDWRDLSFSAGNGELGAPGPLALTLRRLRIAGNAAEAGDAPALATIDAVTAEFLPAELSGPKRRVRSLALARPVIEWSRETTGRFAAGSAKPAASPESAAAPSEAGEAPGVFTVDRWTVADGEVTLRDLGAADAPLPAARFGIEGDFRDLSFGDGLPESPAVQTLTLRAPRVGDREEEPAFEAESIEARFRVADVLDRHRVESFAMKKPVLNLTDTALPAWVVEKLSASSEEAAPSESPSATEPKEESPPSPIWTVDELAVEEGIFRVDTGARGDTLPRTQGQFRLVSREAEAGAGTGKDLAGEATHPYRVELTRIRVRSRPPRSGEAAVADPKAAEVSKAEPRPRPDGLPEAPAEPDPSPRLGGLFPKDAPPPPAPADGAEAKVAGEGQERGSNGFDVGFVKSLIVDFTAEGLQRDRRIEKIAIDGATLQIGEGLRQFVEGDDKGKAGGDGGKKPEAATPGDGDAGKTVGGQAAAAASEPEKPEKGWRIGEFSVEHSRVRFEALIPQIAGLEFDIETKLEDLPLSGTGMQLQDKPQKIELSGIEIRDPYDGFLRVAYLPSVFAEFTLAGLANRRVDKVDLIGPELNVGQPLFWWVDYQRNYRKQNEGVAVGFEGAVAPDPAPAEDAEGEPGWEIKQINAHFGKIVIAPVGYPIGVVPFPFEATTNMDKGDINLKLRIPNEDHVYEFPNLQLSLHGLEGKIEFNVPIKQESNNLVQTFELKKAVWQQFVAEKLYLTVTYDTNGIFGRFGGAAYNGYAEGEFNVYLDDLGKWDAWVSGTELDMGPITRAIAPEQFVMDGKVSGKLVSEGRNLVFGETYGELVSLTPGRINVTKVDDLLENLPESWSAWKKSFAKIGFDVLKDFDYDEGRGDLYFLNRDGWLRLALEGPEGARKFNLYAHDWRGEKKTDPDAETAAGDTETKHETETKNAGAVAATQQGTVGD